MISQSFLITIEKMTDIENLKILELTKIKDNNINTSLMHVGVSILMMVLQL